MAIFGDRGIGALLDGGDCSVGRIPVEAYRDGFCIRCDHVVCPVLRWLVDAGVWRAAGRGARRYNRSHGGWDFGIPEGLIE